MDVNIIGKLLINWITILGVAIFIVVGIHRISIYEGKYGNFTGIFRAIYKNKNLIDLLLLPTYILVGLVILADISVEWLVEKIKLDKV